MSDNLAYTTIKPSSPIFVSFELTYKCNNNCEYCYNYLRHNKNSRFYEASLKERKNVLEDVKASSVPVVNFTGGEPTLSPDLFELISYSRELGLFPTLNTNARLITNEKAKKLSDAELGGALVSLCGSSAYNHDAQTKVKGSWVETMRGIKALKKFKIPVTVNFTATKKNYPDLENVARLSKSLGVNFSIGRFIPHLQQKDYVAFELSNADLNQILKTIKKIRSYGINVNFEIPVPYCAVEEDYIDYIKPCQCSAGIIFCVISPDLSVKACPISNDFAGTLRSFSLKEIWQSEKMDLWRKTSSFPQKCISCPLFSLCKGGCRQAALFHGKTISAYDPLARPSDKNFKKYVNYWDYRNTFLISPTDILKISKKFISRKEGFGATILFEDYSYIFLIGNVSCNIWNFIDGKRSVADIVNLISSNFNKDKKEIEKDVMDFLIQLISLNAIRLKNENKQRGSS